MSTAAWQVSKYTPGLTQGSPVSPFMKSSNSEYGNWFHRGPPSPFGLNNGLAPASSFNLGPRKVSVRRVTSYLSNDRSPFNSLTRNETSLITPLNTTARNEAGLSHGLTSPRSQYTSSRPGIGLERSLSYSGEASPREALQNETDTFPHSRSTLERSNTSFDLANNGHLDRTAGASLRRSRTFTEGMGNPPWKPLNSKEAIDFHTHPITSSGDHKENTAGRTSVTGSTLPNVANSTNLTRQKMSDQKTYLTSPGPPSRTVSYMFNPRENQEKSSTGLSQQDDHNTWNNGSSSRPPSVNPYSLSDLPVKTYHGLVNDGKLNSPMGKNPPRNNPYESDSMPAFSGKIDSFYESTQQNVPNGKVSNGKSVKSILKKKSAYETTNNYFSFSRSAEDSFLKGWAGYSNPSAFNSFMNSSGRQQGTKQFQNEAANTLPEVNKRTSGKRVTFSF